MMMNDGADVDVCCDDNVVDGDVEKQRRRKKLWQIWKNG